MKALCRENSTEHKEDKIDSRDQCTHIGFQPC